MRIDPTNIVQYIKYMLDHVLIHNIIRLWPSEKSLINWMQNKWSLMGQIDMELGGKVFFG